MGHGHMFTVHIQFSISTKSIVQNFVYRIDSNRIFFVWNVWQRVIVGISCVSCCIFNFCCRAGIVTCSCLFFYSSVSWWYPFQIWLIFCGKNQVVFRLTNLNWSIWRQDTIFANKHISIIRSTAKCFFKRRILDGLATIYDLTASEILRRRFTLSLFSPKNIIL